MGYQTIRHKGMALSFHAYTVCYIQYESYCMMYFCLKQGYKAEQDRMTKMFVGHKHNFEKNLLKCAWSPDDSKITAGSADR